MELLNYCEEVSGVETTFTPVEDFKTEDCEFRLRVEFSETATSD